MLGCIEIMEEINAENNIMLCKMGCTLPVTTAFSSDQKILKILVWKWLGDEQQKLLKVKKNLVMNRDKKDTE